MYSGPFFIENLKIKHMKSRIIFVSVLLAVFFIGSVSPVFGQKQEAKPKLKSVIVYEEKANSLVAKKYKESEIYYDQRGNILEEIYYKDGRVTKHFKYTYDADDNKIKEEEYDTNGKLKEYSEYKFENGLRTEKVVYDASKTVKLRKTYQYTNY